MTGSLSSISRHPSVRDLRFILGRREILLGNCWMRPRHIIPKFEEERISHCQSGSSMSPLSLPELRLPRPAPRTRNTLMPPGEDFQEVCISSHSENSVLTNSGPP